MSILAVFNSNRDLLFNREVQNESLLVNRVLQVSERAFDFIKDTVNRMVQTYRHVLNGMFNQIRLFSINPVNFLTELVREIFTINRLESNSRVSSALFGTQQPQILRVRQTTQSDFDIINN